MQNKFYIKRLHEKRTMVKPERPEEKDVKRFDFTKAELDYIKENANFNNEQLKIFNLLTHKDGRKSIVYISMEVNMSESTVKRRVREIKKKILRVFR